MRPHKKKRTHNNRNKANKNVSKRWKKGHSCSSNPQYNEHRQKAGMGYTTSGKSTLTAAALAKLDASNEQMSVEGSEFDATSIGGNTFKTFATNFTECTNVTFNQIHRLWTSNSALHKEMLAVLAAVTEVIKEHGGKESETEYFAALITALDTMNTEDSLTAATYLLSLVISKVPDAVLQKRFSDVSKKLLDLLVKNANSESTSLIKSLLRCLAVLLSAQDISIWEASSTQQIYLGILAFITHNKPKVRKTSHESVELILKSSALMKSEKAPSCHPMASFTAKHCIQRIEENGAGTDAIGTLHVLALVKKIFGVLHQNDIQAMCETILKIMTLATPMVVACCMQALYGLVNTSPKLSNLGTKLNAQIITALYDYQPLETDIQPTRAWLSVMEKSVISLCRQDIDLGEHHLPKIFTLTMKYLMTEHTQLHQAAANCMKVLLQECVAHIQEEKLTSAANGSCVQQIVKTLSSGLTYQYHAAWKSVISVLAVMLQVIGKPCQQLMKPALTFLADMRESQNFTFNAEVESAIGTAVQSMGPRNVLSVIPLKITGDGTDLDFPRSWLMPVLEKHISNTELGFFVNYFLPLAKKLDEKSAQFKTEDNLVAAKSYEAVVLQIWSLLPSFCDRPTDVAVSFKAIARILGITLTEKPSLRNSILSALRKIIYTNLDKDDDNVKEIGRFAKNFLPILFNLLIDYAINASENPLQVTVFETIKAYVQIADKKLLEDYTETSLKRFNDSECTKAKKAVLLDLCISTVHAATVSQVKELFKLATDNFQNTDHTLQKKSYRILEIICGSDSEACSEFVNQEVLLIQQTLLNSLSSSSPSSKAPRLRCLIHIVKKLKSTETEFLKVTIPEAILCTRDIGIKARQAAYTLLVEIGKTFIRFESSDEDHEDAITEYFKLIFEGLALSPTVISATLLAMTRIMYEFKDIINLSLLDSLLEHCCVLLVSKSREIVKSALSFLQVLLSSFPDYQLGCHLDRLILTLTAMKEDARHHFRFRTKMIYARLIRKFGYQIIYNKCPDNVKKVLANIQKAEKRKKRKKTKSHDDEEEVDEVELSAPVESVEDVLKTIDPDLEDDDDSKEQKKKAKNKKSKPGGQAWLQENTSENITDFMDISASRSVTTTKPPKASNKTSKESAFKTSSDGRLLISNDDEKDEKESSEDDDDLDEVLQSIGAKMKSDQSRKRKRQASFPEECDAPKYIAGGQGIHRPIKKPSKSQSFGTEYKSKKAGGDIKQKGKPDPYAYIQLNYQDLNKRKRAKLKGKFNGLVKSARKGAQQGSKAMKFNRKTKR